MKPRIQCVRQRRAGTGSRIAARARRRPGPRSGLRGDTAAITGRISVIRLERSTISKRRNYTLSRGESSWQYGDHVTRSRSGQARPAEPATARQVTIQDVARAAAVSRQTVSNVLNGSGRVGDAARARVLAAVEALGYYPHHGARSLRSRRTRQVAYVMPHMQLLPGNYIMQQFLQSLAAACARRSYSLVVVVPEGDPGDEMRRLIASRSVDAFLLSEVQQDDPRVEAADRGRDAVRVLRPDRPGAAAELGRHRQPRGRRRGRGARARPGVRADRLRRLPDAELLGRRAGRRVQGRAGRRRDLRRPGGHAAGRRRQRAQEDPVAAVRGPAWAAAGRHRDRQRPARRGGLQRGRGTAAADRPGPRRHRLRRQRRGRPDAPAADHRGHPGRRDRRAGGGPGAAPGRPRTRSAARRGGAGQAAPGREHGRARPGA